MIIVARKVGQLGNRLSLFAHLIACAHEHNVRVINLAFGEYAQYFRTTCQDVLCRYPAAPAGRQPKTWTRGLFYGLAYYPSRLLAAANCTHLPFKVIRLTLDQAFDLGDQRFVQWAKRRKFVVLQGWRFRDPTAVARHAQVIREYFRPIAIHEEAATRTAQSARRGSDVLIGVHIRHGDYQRFLGGKYYYSTEQYGEIMQRVERLFAPRKVSFLVCSNAPQDRRRLGDLQLSFGTGHLVEDMYAFAQCDYLIGPPSTFTMWASFYGCVPLCSLESPDAEIQLDSYRLTML